MQDIREVDLPEGYRIVPCRGGDRKTQSKD